jgi:hypothetical protein
MSDKHFPIHQVEKYLVALFRRNGYVRVVNEERRRELGQKYKKGYEVRLVARSKEELENMRRSLEKVGFKPGKPYKKRAQFVQPIYGKSAVAWFVNRAEKQS